MNLTRDAGAFFLLHQQQPVRQSLEPSLGLRVTLWIIALAPSTALLALALPPLFTAALAWSLPAKLALATPPFLAAGAAMGLALPTGFLQFGDRHKPWFWALNGASSVLASALSLALAMEFGFLFTALLGSACYALATALSRNPA